MITEDKFIPFFQKNISIILDSKILRQGKLLLFCIKDFYLHFTINCNDITKTFELPYPFRTYTDPVSSNILILDYKINTFTQDLNNIMDRAKPLYNNEKHMKFFNNVVKIVETP